MNFVRRTLGKVKHYSLQLVKNMHSTGQICRKDVNSMAEIGRVRDTTWGHVFAF